MKERIKATHFIEVCYSDLTNKYYEGKPAKIVDLQYDLNDTNTLPFLKTIAIFKIKFHEAHITIPKP